MTHACAECGLEHSDPGRPSEDPMVKVAKIEAGRDLEIARIGAKAIRDDLMREIDALRAELTVRQEEPPVAETTVVQAEVPEPEPEPAPIVVDAPVTEAEPEMPPKELKTPRAAPQRRGFFG